MRWPQEDGGHVACCLGGLQEGHSCNQGTGHPCGGLTKPGIHLEGLCIALGHDVQPILVCLKLEMLPHNNPYPKLPNGVKASLGTSPKTALEVDKELISSSPNMSPGFPGMAWKAPGYWSHFLLAEQFKCFSPDSSMSACGCRTPKGSDRDFR